MDITALFSHRATLEHGSAVLEDPGAAEAEAAYRALPKAGTLRVRCPAERLSGLLPVLERAGFYGLVLRSRDLACSGFELLAFKGKEGACLDTGRSARYLGSAAAVLDDDGHLLSGTVRICEKTAALYARLPYARTLAVRPANPALLARLEHDPVPFACDTFEENAQRLAAALAAVSPRAKAWTALLYPGPFKLLVLRDGSVVRRGQPVRVDARLGRALVVGEGALLLTENLAATALPAESFPLRYLQAGAGFLLEPFAPGRSLAAAGPADLSSLNRAPASMRARLRRMLERGDPYFVATGSDPRESGGCCPSDAVGAANRLAEAGVLQVWRRPGPLDACPVTFFAFAGEFGSEAGPLAFALNRELREAVRAKLGAAGTLGRGLRRALCAVLLAFAALSVGYALLGAPASEDGSAEAVPLGSVLGLERSEVVLVGLFRGLERCAFCERMERNTREALDASFAEELRAGRVVFREINTATPEFRRFKQHYGLFTSSIVLVEIRHGEEGRWKVFGEAWHLTEEPAEFAAALGAELRAFLERNE